jgi:hypothetical protein
MAGRGAAGDMERLRNAAEAGIEGALSAGLGDAGAGGVGAVGIDPKELRDGLKGMGCAEASAAGGGTGAGLGAGAAGGGTGANAIGLKGIDPVCIGSTSEDSAGAGAAGLTGFGGMYAGVGDWTGAGRNWLG